MREDLIEIVAGWVTTGQLAEADKPVLKAAYLAHVRAEPGCTTCDDFWSEVRQHFFYAYKQLNRTTVAQKIRKYGIIGSSYLMLPGSSVAYVNEGEESEDRKVLTDEMAEFILAKYPEYKNLVGINPAWQELQDAIADHEDEADETEDSDEDEANETELQAQLTALQEENKHLKQENATLKGQLTRAKNAAHKSQDAPAPIDPAAGTGNGTPPADLTTGDTSTAKTGAAGDAGSSSSADSSDSAGNSGANAVKSTVEQAKS